MAEDLNPGGAESLPKALYLSQLTFDLHRSDVWRLLGDTYALHQRLLCAFPEQSEGGSGRMLFRVDSGKGEAKILVQSDKMPDWSSLAYLLADHPQGPKEWRLYRENGSPHFVAGQRLRYRLRANPTFRALHDRPAVPASDRSPGQQALVKGKRYAHLTRDKQGEWLARKGLENGFGLPLHPVGSDWLDPFLDEPEKQQAETKFDVRITPMEWMRGTKPTISGDIRHYSVDFEGVLTVTDPVAFTLALANGIGGGKAFGFGLLSVARAGG